MEINETIVYVPIYNGFGYYWHGISWQGSRMAEQPVDGYTHVGKPILVIPIHSDSKSAIDKVYNRT